MKSPCPIAGLSGAFLIFGLSSLSCAAVHSRVSPVTAPANEYRSRLAWVNALDPRTFDAPVGRNAYGAPNSDIALPMCFPILGRGYGFSDEFGAPRDGHRHLGQDLFAPKMTPLVAVFDGTVYFWSNMTQADGLSPHNIINVVGDNGYTAKYMHVNNDTPGTNDGRGGTAYAFAPGLVSGQHVRVGQFIGWVGNSGNAESTPPHTHFEIWGPNSLPVNTTASLRKATRLTQARAEDVPLAPGSLRTGETAWEGIVHGLDSSRGVVVLNLLATETRSGTFASTRPGLTYVRLAPATVVRENETGSPVRFGSLRAGERIVLTGKAPGKNRSFVATAATVTDGFASSRWASSQPAASSAASPSLGKQISNWWNGVKRRGRL